MRLAFNTYVLHVDYLPFTHYVLCAPHCVAAGCQRLVEKKKANKVLCIHGFVDF